MVGAKKAKTAKKAKEADRKVRLGDHRADPLDDPTEVVTGVFALLKVRSPGDPASSWSFRKVGDISDEELHSALMVQVHLLTKNLAREWEIG